MPVHRAGVGTTVTSGEITFPIDKDFAAATDDALRFGVTADTNDRVVLNADGKLEWGSGAAASDVNLYRSAAATLKTDNNIVVNSLDISSSNVSPLLIQNTSVLGRPGGSSTLEFANASYWQVLNFYTNAVRALQIDNAGKFILGAAGDTNIYRSAADILATDDDFLINTAGKGLKWIAGNEQTTVGALGIAAAPPITPTKYLKVKDSDGTTLVIPAYAAS